MSSKKELEKRSEEEESLQNKQDIDAIIAEAFKYIKSITFLNTPKRVKKKRSKP